MRIPLTPGTKTVSGVGESVSRQVCETPVVTCDHSGAMLRWSPALHSMWQHQDLERKRKYYFEGNDNKTINMTISLKAIASPEQWLRYDSWAPWCLVESEDDETQNYFHNEPRIMFIGWSNQCLWSAKIVTFHDYFLCFLIFSSQLTTILQKHIWCEVLIFLKNRCCLRSLNSWFSENY